MGKIKTRILGLEEVEEKQKKEQKEKSALKKSQKKKEEKKEEQKKENLSVEKNKEKKETKEEGKKTQPRKRGKKHEENKKMIEKNKIYSLVEAVSLLKKFKKASFDESVEIHISVDETGLKGEADLPYSTGKTIKVKIVDDKVLEDIEKGKIDFDILISHPSYMPRLTKFAKILGPKGLMPNPKTGTISANPEETAKKFQKGVLRWKTESKFPLIHQMLGKISMKEEELIANIEKFIDSVGKKHIKKAFVKTTMSPSVRII
ncbi:MAG: hypothetical protein NZM02_00395 [Patescibacteria group bacterium]|nr:hypothetical protein [Patescibacteria group bacterium]